jgi:hypothetical protein
MSNDTATWLPILSALVGALGALIVAILTIRSQRQKLDAELLFQRQKFEEELATQRARLKAEFATESSAETALRHLLELYHLPYRSFPMIRHHIGGFEANELRKLLVRAGAVRFMAADGTELWALRERVVDDFKHSRWKHPQAPQNKVPDSELFPAALKDPTQF